MTKPRHIPLILATIAFHPVIGQTQFQQTMASPMGGEDYVHGFLSYTDGSVIIASISDSLDFLVTRYDAAGVPIWRRAISAWPQSFGINFITATPDGGFATVEPRSTSFPDSTLIDVAKFDASGATVWARTIVTATGFGATGVPTTISASDSGELFIVAMGTGQSSVTKLDANGVVLWSTRVWDWDLGDGLEQIIQTEPLTDGGCVFLGDGLDDNTGTAISIGRLDQSGTLLWAKSFTYAAMGSVMDYPRLVPNVGQQIVVTGALSIFGVGAYSAVLRVDLSGQLIRADLYESTNSGTWQLQAKAQSLPNDGLVLTGGDYFTTNAIVLRMDQDGELISGYRCRSAYVGQVEHGVDYLWCMANGDSLWWTGSILAQDTIFGTENYIPLLWRSGTDISTLCGLDSFTVARYEVPSGVITTADVGDTASVAYPMVSFPMTNDPLPLPTIGSYCGLVSVQEELPATGFQVWPNPSSVNEAISIRSGESGTLELLDAAGRVLSSRRVTAGNSRFESRLSAGVYLLRLASPDGRTATRTLLVQ